MVAGGSTRGARAPVRRMVPVSCRAAQWAVLFSSHPIDDVGIKEVDEGIWTVSITHHDLGYVELEQKTTQPLDNPFGTRLSPMS